MNTEAVLFDLDGTLVDTIPLITQTYRKVFRDLEIPWGDDDVLKLIGLPLAKISSHFLDGGEERFIELYQKYYKLDHDRLTKLFPGTYETLSRLKSLGLKTGLVTSKGKPVSLRTLAFTKLDGLLDVVVTAHDVSNPKPHPESLLKALASLGTALDRSIMVGDSRFDILTGQRAGTRTLGVSWGLESREALERLNPTGLLDSWADMDRYL